ncbi:hypothetical protein GIB67_034702 [Kingdonia uniflora]|uniref:Uncharacterized protein n=1 Tax=Kingdonia uniflora TaxID=39325 RepID=A0A7J7ML95_9MAGN|nr:hypothetical protein GIB67_034702 [Kingdonia uniflora]
MARSIFSQTLIRISPTTTPSPSFLSSRFQSRFVNHRNKSSKPEKGIVIEVDLNAVVDPEEKILHQQQVKADGGGGEEVEEEEEVRDYSSIRKREVSEAINQVISDLYVKKMAPEWLPLYPGSSYWVPPREAMKFNGFLDLFGGFGGFVGNVMTEEEAMSFRSRCGHPSSAYFCGARGFPHPMKMMGMRKTKIFESEDDEG